MSTTRVIPLPRPPEKFVVGHAVTVVILAQAPGRGPGQDPSLGPELGPGPGRGRVLPNEEDDTMSGK